MSYSRSNQERRERASLGIEAGFTARARCEQALNRIERVDPQLNAFLEITREYALARADRLDLDMAAGRDAGPLAGVPIAVKDNICTSFGHTTCASRMLSEYRSPYDATAVGRVVAAGAIIVGKTNLDEFGMGSSTEYSAVFTTRNPWDAERVPGGSSGGAAAAVAARMVPMALGSDTGGSVRQPAAFCGVVGLKPTCGRVSRYGLVAYGSSLEQIGPITTNVRDCTALLQTLSGPDPMDATSLPDAVPDYCSALDDRELEQRRQKLKIGVPQEYLGDGLDTEVRAAVEAAIDVYRRMGADVVELTLPHTHYCIAAYYLLATAECSSNLARFDGVHYGRCTINAQDVIELYCRSRAEGFGDEVKRRIMLGTFVLSAGYADQYYRRALIARRLIRTDFERAFEKVDALLCPTTPTPAFRIGEKAGDPLQMYLADVYTTAANLAGVPAISIPCGLSRSGLPIGLQLMAPWLEEACLLQVARLYERDTDWHKRQPPVCAI